jgi:ribosomal protein S6--L-glutamate ligase
MSSGRKVVAAAELHSSELDYRRGEDAVVPTKLTPEERRLALAAAKACGMRFAGIDFIRGPRKPYLLESNPSPMFAVFEEKTGLDVAGPLGAYLLASTLALARAARTAKPSAHITDPLICMLNVLLQER